MRTLVIASVAAVAAAVFTSRFSVAGSVTAAAMTPVIVAIVSELLHRPTAKVAERLTTERDALPEAAREPPARDLESQPGEPPVRVYSSTRPAATSRRRVVWRVVIATAVIAFAVAVAVLTLPELIAGESLGGNRDTTFFGGGSKKKDEPQQAPETTSEQQTTPDPQETAPTTTEPPPETTPTTTEEPQQTTPTTTAPAPKSR